MSADMSNQVDVLLDNMWSAWTNMFPMIPFWDPYGALSAVFLAIIALAFLVRMVAR